jgi:formate dehydrogenase iron-sulfur subunit
VPDRVGFFTDTSLCIGCKACEVACKEWNGLPSLSRELSGQSYDNTRMLGESAWRHVAFIEQRVAVDGPQSASEGDGRNQLRWLMSSDVCKHCTEAACLDVCPTGSLFRTEFGSVVVQEDICNGCGYCVPACPFGVIERREDDGRVFKCTLCYDRLRSGMQPACSQACPTDSIQFGRLDDLRDHAARRLTHLRESGISSARLYGDDPGDGVGGAACFFLLLDDPELYRLPTAPMVTTRHLASMWAHAATAGATMLALVAGTLLARRNDG